MYRLQTVMQNESVEMWDKPHDSAYRMNNRRRHLKVSAMSQSELQSAFAENSSAEANFLIKIHTTAAHLCCSAGNSAALTGCSFGF